MLIIEEFGPVDAEESSSSIPPRGCYYYSCQIRLTRDVETCRSER